jgi:hypothetical protein
VCLSWRVDVSRTESLDVRQYALRPVRGSAYHLDLPQRVVAVIVEVVRLPVIYAHYTEQQLTVQSQCQRTAGSSLGSDDDLDVLINLVLQDLCLGELLVLIGGQPDTSKLARLEKQIFGKKHCGGG